MQEPRLSAPRAAGAFCALLGAAAAGSWFVPVDQVARLVPGLPQMGIVNPLLFVAIGFCFFEATRPVSTARGDARRRAFAVAIALLIALPLAYLFETATGISLGIDIARPGVAASVDNPHPGRLSPNASIGFLCTGLAFWLCRTLSTKRRRAMYLVATFIVAAIGLSGLAGHVLGLESLYKIADFNRIMPTTALGLAVASAGLWKLLEQAEAFDMRKAGARIHRRSLAVVVLVALSCGIAGFGLMRSIFEESVSQNMLLTATTNAISLGHSIDLRLWFPRLVPTRASVSETLGKLSRDPDDADSTIFLRKLGAGFLGAELTAIEFYDAHGRLAAAAGSVMRDKAKFVFPLRNTGQKAFLAWDGGYVLLAENDVFDAGRKVGRVLTEQRLPLFDRLLAQVRSASSGSDAAICSRDRTGVVCAPTPLRPSGIALPVSDAADQAGLPVVRALRGERAVAIIKDADGEDVVSAAAPMKDFGIAVAVRTERDVLYEPLRSRFAYLALALAAVIALGVYAQRSQVQPVLQRLVHSEQKLKGILEEQSELVALAEPDGKLHYVNPAFGAFFGLAPDRLAQASLHACIDPADRGAFATAVASALRSENAVKAEYRARFRDASERWVSWTCKVQRDADGRRLLHFVGRDVTERKQAEERLAESERFVRQVTDNLPVRIAYVDRDLRYRFVNLAQARRLRLAREKIVGRALGELADAPCAQLDAAIADVLQGRMQHLECDETVDGKVARVEWQLIPDVAEDGRIDGFYSTSVDITERAAAERALRDVATIFDNTTDWVVQTDRLGNILYMNPAARSALGFGPDEDVSNRNFSRFHTLESSRLFPDVVLPAARADGVWVGETTVGVAGGGVVPVNCMLIAHRDAEGSVGRYSAIMRDISLEQAIRLHRKRQAAVLRSVTEAMPAPVAVVQRDQRYRFVNSSFERWIGTRREHILGKHLREVLGAADYEHISGWVQRALDGETVSFEKDFMKEGVRRHLALTFVPLWLDGGEIDGFAVVGQDITQHKKEESRLLQLTQRDALTGLLNRAGFEQFLESRFGDPAGAQSLALLCIDLDYFKPVNDTYGHPAGDSVLRQFAQRMTNSVRPTDAVARLGGDEFAVVLAGIREKANAHFVADKIVAAAHAPFKVGDSIVSIGASVGVAFGADAPNGWQDLIAQADAMLYRAKAGGRGRQASAA